MKNLFLLLLGFIYCSFTAAQKFDFLPTSKSGKIAEHKYYSVSYSPEYKQAEWVAYYFKREDLKAGTDEKISIMPDPDFAETDFITEKEIKKSKHQVAFIAPLEDLSFSIISWTEAHYQSNLTPMVEDFYVKTWDQMNQVVRSHVRTNDNLYVISGPIFDDKSLERGNGKIHVPASYFRVLLDYSKPDIKMIGYIMPHKGGYTIIKNLAVAVDEIEEVTGIDFFPALPDELENELEGKVDLTGWFVK